ncbi:unnamed protein product [Sphagnum troendelagicum]
MEQIRQNSRMNLQDQRVDRSTQEAANRKKSGDPGRRQSRKKVTTRIPTITTAATAMSLKNKPVRNGSSPGSFERRKRDKTGHLLNGLVADLERRTQVAFETNNNNFHVESIQGIHRLLLQIQKLERPFVNQQPKLEVSARLKLLQDWLEHQGVQIDGLRLEGGFAQGAGVMATKEFKKGEMMLVVPATAMMTSATAICSKEDVGLLYQADPVLRQMPTLVLTLHLLFEKHRPAETPSKWAGYIASLPGQSFSAEGSSEVRDRFITPLSLSMEAVEALEGTATLIEMHKALRNYARQFTHVRSLLQQLHSHSTAISDAVAWFTWAEFCWAASVVMTRQNPVPGRQDIQASPDLALIPLLDMFNHEEGEITCHFDVSQQHMELTAKRPFQQGEQVFICYGNRSNSELLLYSGFVPDYNSKDRIKVPVALSQLDPLHQKKVALLKWLGLPIAGWLELYHDGTPSPELANWIRVASMDDLAVVTENLRATIALQTQQTAALLQDRATLVQGLKGPASAVFPGDGVHVDFGKSYKDSSDKRLINTAEGRGGQIAVIHHNSQTRSENHVSFNNAEVTEVMALDVASSELLEDKAEETRTLISSLQKTVELEELIVSGSETLLGECLIPAEATLLAEICRARVANFGERKKKPVDVYASKGNEMDLQEEVKAPASREVVMAMKIWQQERDALQKAIERGVKAQFSDKEL